MISRDGMFNAVWLATAPPTYLPAAASSARTVVRGVCVLFVCERHYLWPTGSVGGAELR
jgi:hypothetical protein